jgi:hypothetical protein
VKDDDARGDNLLKNSENLSKMFLNKILKFKNQKIKNFPIKIYFWKFEKFHFTIPCKNYLLIHFNTFWHLLRVFLTYNNNF